MEQPLSSFSACCLSSINFSQFVLDPFTDKAQFDFESFGNVVDSSVIYLNEILDEGIQYHPLEEQKESTRRFREIGLGSMGIADMFIKMGIKYGSQDSLLLLNSIMKYMINAAAIRSALLAKEYGPAPAYDERILESEFAKKNFTEETKKLIRENGLRNTQMLTVAPTGSISTMLGVSGGIEPLFQISFNRKTLSINDGQETLYKVFSPVVRELMETLKIDSEEDLPDYVISSHELNGRERIDLQAIVQKYTDAAISSTINLREEAAYYDIFDLIMYAHEKELKGVTFYRDGCARAGILTVDKKEVKKDKPELLFSTDKIVTSFQKEIKKDKRNSNSSKNGVCPICGGTLIYTNGCSECQDCGGSACSL